MAMEVNMNGQGTDDIIGGSTLMIIWPLKFLTEPIISAVIFLLFLLVPSYEIGFYPLLTIHRFDIAYVSALVIWIRFLFIVLYGNVFSFLFIILYSY